MQHECYDVAIVGGGNVGLTLALALAQKTSLSILVIESQAESTTWDASTYHHRVSAIAPSSQRIFQSLGVWPAIKAKRISPFEQIAIWDALGGEMQFSSREVGEPVLGYIIENNVIQSTLAEKLSQYAHVTYLTGQQLVKYRIEDTYAEFETSSKQTYTSKLMVAADGARSWLRQQAGIACHQHDYDQIAIVTTIQSDTPHKQTARQLFLDTGPIGFLPLTNNSLSSIVWSLPSELAKQYLALDDTAFEAQLNTACSSYINKVSVVSKRHPFPLSHQQAHQYIMPRLALVGDAAHTVHPLAGQGVNMGLLDAASLAEIIITANKNRRDIGGESALRRYERWRKADNLLMSKGIDVLKQVFAVKQPALQQVRSTALKTANQYSVIKNIFTRHAVGNRDGLPTLAKI